MATDDRAVESPPDLPAVYGATFLIRFAFGITTAVFATYIVGHNTGLAPSQVGTVGLVTALASIAEFGTVLFSGMAADRWGRWKVLASGMGVAAVATALFTTTRDPFALGALNFAFGIASGAILAASLAIVADEAPHVVRGLSMGRFDAVNLAGWVIGFAVGFGALGALSVPELAYVFLTGTGALLAGLVYARILLRRHPSAAAGAPSRGPIDLRGIVRRKVLIVTLPWLVIYMLIGTALVFLGTSAGSIGVAPIYLALAIGAGGGLLTVTQPWFGRLSDRFGPTPLMMVGTAGFVLALVGGGWLATVGKFEVAPVGLVVLGAVGALGYGPAALSALAELSVSISRATTMAIYTLCISLGTATGLFLSSQLYANFGALGLDAFFGLVAVILIVFAGLRYRDARRTPTLKIPAQ